jgi:hypothetical protein
LLKIFSQFVNIDSERLATSVSAKRASLLVVLVSAEWPVGMTSTLPYVQMTEVLVDSCKS